MTGRQWWDDQIALAKAVAYVAHKGQRRVTEPQIEHVRRVVAGCATQPARCAAWLHDVVEDTPITIFDLGQLGFDVRIIRTVRMLTHREGITTAEYLTSIERMVRESETWAWAAWAREVKRADVRDNLSTLPGLSGDYPRMVGLLLPRYRKALELLES